MNDQHTTSSAPIGTARAGDPVPVVAAHAPEPERGWFARRRGDRDWDEQYRAAPIWRRILSMLALGSISLATGIMVATAIAAAIAAAAIAMQSLVT